MMLSGPNGGKTANTKVHAILFHTECPCLSVVQPKPWYPSAPTAKLSQAFRDGSSSLLQYKLRRQDW